MKYKQFVLAAALLLCFLLSTANIQAQTHVVEDNTPVTQVNNLISEIDLMENAAFKEWLLSDTNSQISRLALFVCIAFIISCILFAFGLYLLWHCCCHHRTSKNFFDKSKMDNCQKEGRLGMFVYDIRRERIQTSGQICALLGLKSKGSLALDAYLRLMHHGQNLFDYEGCYVTELVYERKPEMVFLSLYIFPIVSKRGILLGEYGMLQDISIHRHREIKYRTHRDEVKEALNNMENYVNTNPLHARVLHDKFDIIHMNKAAVEIFGADEDELYSICFKSLLADNAMIAGFAKHLWNAEEQGFALNCFKMHIKNGALVDVEIYTTKVKNRERGDILTSSVRLQS